MLKINEYLKVKYAGFFSDKGITSTSANHIANKGKEMAKSEQAALDNIIFVNTTAGLLSGGEPKVITKGITNDDFNTYRTILKKISDLNTMTAWIREAIKAKNELINISKCVELVDWAKENDIELPKIPDIRYDLTETDVIASWNIDKQAKYYNLEAYCSLVGKWIHPKGAFYEAKKSMDKAIQNPNNVQGSGRDAIVYSYEPSVLTDEVKMEFNYLSDELRSKEAEFNKMKKEIEDAIYNQKVEGESKFKVAYASYNTKMEEFRKEFEIWKVKLQKQMSELKIYLPESIKATFDSISKGNF